MTGNSRRSVVLTLGVTQTLAWGSTYYLPAILAAPMARDLGLSTAWVFGAFSVALLIAAVLGPMAGRRIDRFGGRGVLAASSLVFAAGLCMLGLAGGPVMLILSWLVLGIGMSMGLYEGAFATLAGIYGRDARSAITGITLIAGFASTLCWPISAWLDAEFGWRTACFLWAGAHLFLGLPLNRLGLPAGTRPLATGPAEPEAETGPNRAMLLLAFVFAVTWFTSTAMAAHLPRLLQETGASAGAALAAAALVGPAQVAARLFEFGLLRRFHPLLSARLAVVAHPLGAVALLLIGAPAASLFAILHGAGNGILTIAKGTLPLAIFGPGGYGHRQGWLMAPARVVQAGAPLAFATLLERFGVGALLFPTALGLAGLAALLALHHTSEIQPA